MTCRASRHCVILGLGYSCHAAARHLQADGWRISGTTRSQDKAAALQQAGISAFLFGDGSDPAPLLDALASADAILLSIAPNPGNAPKTVLDPVLHHLGPAMGNLVAQDGKPWLCYLSTVGVYGDHGGAWVDETTECRPVSARSKARVAAETAWQNFADNHDLRLAIYRLSGIYGPGRNPLAKLKRGESRRINKPGQVFNRIHVEDIAQAVALGAAQGAQGLFNITDDEPAPPQEVVAYGAELLEIPPPPLVPFDKADLSPMGRSFYGENKRVSNTRSKQTLGLDYRYPNYRLGLSAELARI